MRAYFVCLASLCAWGAGQAAPALAQADYPFQVVTVAAGTEQDVVARNDGPAPVTVHASLDDDWTATAIVPPYTALRLGRVSLQAGSELVIRRCFGRPNAVSDETVAYRLPFEDGRSFAITQAYGSNLPTHNNPENLYAVDFAMPRGTPVLAARGGVVVDAVLYHKSGGYDVKYWRKANTVSIVHDDGTVAEYAHLSPSAAPVEPGHRVEAGQLIGYSGNTGYTSGAHLHFVVYKPVVHEDKVTRLSLPVVFYSFDPPVRFPPATGMIATARYPSGAGDRLAHAQQESGVTRAGPSFPRQDPDWPD